MKKILTLMAAACVCMSASAFPKALYVKKGDNFLKYNFGVAGKLKYTDGGRKLLVTGYNEAIDLENVDYVKFTAPVSQSLTPSQIKERMIQVGHDIASKVDATSEPGMERAVNAFLHYFIWCDAPEEWKDVPHTDPFEKLGEAMKAALSPGDGGMRVLRRVAGEIYRLDDYYGIYRADAHYDSEGDVEGQIVKVSDADYFEFRFTNLEDKRAYVLKVEPSKEYYDWTESDGTARVPREMKISVSEDGREAGVFDMNFDMNREDLTINVGIDFKGRVHNVVSNLAITDNGITATNEVRINGERFYSDSCTVNGRHLLQYDEWFDNFTWDEYYDSITDDYVSDSEEHIRDIVAKISDARIDVDILGELQAKGRVANLLHVYDYVKESLQEDDENSDDEDYKESNERAVECLNNYSDISLYFDSEKTPFAFMTWDLDEEEDYYDGEYWVDYYPVPLFTFPDMTTYSFEDYFTVTAFSSVIDDLEKIIEDYCALTGIEYSPIER